ncbi:hypothetical protein B6N60_04149 [Richelia sinica FACHB-800]|uniref:Uncharacterized protein n=1 Tax=Richelia sinica FACHB-800 TaxID=1357546 RepID=A0A975TBA3_9NOST|nr:hypothetical protein B6N60_04149 [Richelia sinica FACHB-800]
MAYATLREQEFKMQKFSSHRINHSVTPATSVTSVFFF